MTCMCTMGPDEPGESSTNRQRLRPHNNDSTIHLLLYVLELILPQRSTRNAHRIYRSVPPAARWCGILKGTEMLTCLPATAERRG